MNGVKDLDNALAGVEVEVDDEKNKKAQVAQVDNVINSAKKHLRSLPDLEDHANFDLGNTNFGLQNQVLQTLTHTQTYT